MSILRYFITSKAKRNLLKFFFSRDGAYYTRELARLTGEPLNAVRRELGYMEKAGLLRSYMQRNQKYYEVVGDFPLLAEWKRIFLETDDTAVPYRQTVTGPELKAAKLAGVHGLSEEPRHRADEEPILPGAEVIMNHELLPLKDKETQLLANVEETAAAIMEKPVEEEYPAFTVSSFVDYLKDQLNEISLIALAIIHGNAAKSEEIPAGGVDLLVVGDINKDSLLALVGNIEDRTGVGINLTRMTRSDFDYRTAKGDPLMRRIWSEKKLVVKGRH
jgi:predicted transcriptional regulator